MSEGTLPTTPRALYQGNWDSLNKFISEGNERMDRALAQSAAQKAAREKAQADQLRQIKSDAAKNLKRLDGFDSSVLPPPLRPLFQQYKTEQLESVDYFRVDDPAAVEQVIDNIGNFLTTYSAHTQDESVKKAHDTALTLAGDEAARIEYAEGVGPLSEVKMDLGEFARMELYHNENFGKDFTMQDGVIYGVELDRQGVPVNETPVPITQFTNWKRMEDYDIPMGTKAARSLQQIAIDYVRPETEGFNVNGWDREHAYKTSSQLVFQSLTETGKEVRRRIIENYWPDSWLEDTQLVDDYLNLRKDTSPLLQEKADSISAQELNAIDKLTNFSEWVAKEKEERTPTQKDEGMTKPEAFAEVGLEDAKFRALENLETVFGDVEELTLGDGRGLPYGVYYNFERIRKNRGTIDIDNPMYVREFDANGDLIPPPEGVDPVINISPTDVVVVPRNDGGYQVVIENISVKGSPYSAVALDSVEDKDTLAQLNFYLKEAYNGHIQLEDLVEKALQAKRDFANAAGAERARQGVPAQPAAPASGPAENVTTTTSAPAQEGPLSRFNTGNQE